MSPAGSSSTRCSSSATTLWTRATVEDRGRARGAGARGAAVPRSPPRRPDARPRRPRRRRPRSSRRSPRAQRSALPDLRFMCHALCWGALNQKERAELLDDRMNAWTSLFDVREFRFETVVQAAVLPALVLKPDDEALRAPRGAPRPRRPGGHLPARRSLRQARPAAALPATSERPRAGEPQPAAGPLPIARRRAAVAARLPRLLRRGLDPRRLRRAPRTRHCPSGHDRDVRLPGAARGVPRTPW